MSNMLIDTDTIKAFNKLPRQPRSPSRNVKNHWHFDLRFIHLDPPSHLLFFVQPESEYIHSEHLPLGQTMTSRGSGGIAFFPQTSTSAAPEIARAIIHTFTNVLGHAPHGTKPYAPWSLSTEERGLATAVEKEFKRLGVREELCKIKVLTPEQANSDKAFHRFWPGLWAKMGVQDELGRLIFVPPDPINFSILKVRSWPEDRDENLFSRALKYTQSLTSSWIALKQLPSSKISFAAVEEAKSIHEMLQSTTTEDVQKEADADKPGAAIDYALRLHYGIGVEQSHDLYRDYLVKVIQSDIATAKEKSQAHSLLIDWYILGFEGLPARYCYAAAHHAEQAVILAKDASPSVLFFANHVLEPRSRELPALRQYRAVWDAYNQRTKDVEKEREKAEKKRAAASNRYMCAAHSCYIQASKGQALVALGNAILIRSLLIAARKRADWQNHKPFCKPGAECSILEKELIVPATASKDENTLSIPICGPDGNPVMLSSSTMSPKAMKELQAAFSKLSGGQGNAYEQQDNDQIGTAHPSSSSHPVHIATHVLEELD